jgi:branched-chain amino acid transport system ATP-binding protein
MLRLARVDAGYGDTLVLRDVDLVVPDGSVVSLLGPNGAGKTTLLRAASGLLRPSAGSVVLDGEDVTGRAPHELVARGVCHIPEGRGIFRNLTVRERLGQVAGTLSGGQQQMLALARAYVTDARLVLLDEVSMGLAPLIVDEIFAFVERLSAAGSSLLLVEQYVTRALAISDFVYLLNKGRVTFAGEPGELDEQQVFAGYVGAEI